MSDEPEISSEPSPAPPPVSPFAFARRPTFIIGALFIAWIFLGQAGKRLMPHQPDMPVPTASPMIRPAVQDVKDTQIAELQQRLEAMDAKLKALDSGAPAKLSDDSATTAKIADLQAKLDALTEAHSAQAGDSAQVTEALHKHEEEIANLKAQLTDTQAQALHRLTLISALGMLKDAVLRGESFAEPLKRMNDLSKDDAGVQPLLAQLAPYANDNAATVTILQSQFEAVIPQALSHNDNSFMRHLESMIRIRKVGEQQTGKSDEAIIARAEAKLNHGDVKAGVDELAVLSPAAAKAFVAWNKKAQAFLAIHDVLDTLQLALLQEKSAAAEPTPSPAAQ